MLLGRPQWRQSYLTGEPSLFMRDWCVPWLRPGTVGGVVVPTRSRPESRRPSVEV